MTRIFHSPNGSPMNGAVVPSTIWAPIVNPPFVPTSLARTFAAPDFVKPISPPTVAATPTIAGWSPNVGDVKVPLPPPLRYAEPDFEHPDKVLPYVPTAITLNNWSPTIGEKSATVPAPLQYAKPDFVHPEKVLPSTVVAVIGWIPTDAPPKSILSAHTETFDSPVHAVLVALTPPSSLIPEGIAQKQPQKYVRDDATLKPVFVSAAVQAVIDSWIQDAAYRTVAGPHASSEMTMPTLALPPYQVTIAEWLANVAQNAVKALQLSYAEPDYVSSTIPIPPVTPASWVSNLGASFFGKFQPGDTLTHPETVVSIITTAAWLQLIASNRLPQKYASPDVVAPILPQPTVQTSSVAAWFAQLAQQSVAQQHQVGDFVESPYPLPTVLVASLISSIASQAVVQAHQAGDLFTGSPLPLPAAFVSAWIEQLAQQAIAPVHQPGDMLTRPDVVPSVTVAALLGEVARAAVAFSKVMGDTFTGSPFPLPASQVTIDHWLQLLAQNALPQRFSQVEAQAKPEATLPTVTTESIDSWLQYLAANAVRLAYQVGDFVHPDKALPPYQFTVAAFKPSGEQENPARTFKYAAPDYAHPEKALPPYQFTISAWAPTIGQNGLPQSYAKVFEYLAPITVIPFVPASIQLPGWLGEIAQAAKVFSHGGWDIFDSPVLPQPPAQVTIASWLQQALNATLGHLYKQSEQPGPSFVPSLPTLPAWTQQVLNKALQQTFSNVYDAVLHGAVTRIYGPDRWNQNIGVAAVRLPHTQPESFSGSPIPLPTVSLASWLEALANNALPQPHTPTPEWTAPTMFNLVAPVAPTIAGWLANLAANAVITGHAKAPEYNAPVRTIPFVPAPPTIANWLGNVGQNGVVNTFARAFDAQLHSVLLALIPPVWDFGPGAPGPQPLHVQSDPAAGPLLPQAYVPAPITIANWLATIGQAVVAMQHAQGPSYSAPEKVLPFSFLSGWLGEIAQAAKAFTHAIGEAQAAPVSPSQVPTVPAWLPPDSPFSAVAEPHKQGDVIAPVNPFTIPKLPSWLPPDSPFSAMLEMHRQSDVNAPVRTIPYIPAPITMNNWQQLLAPNAQPPHYQPGDTWSGPTLMTSSVSYALQIAAMSVYAALGMASAEITLALGALGASLSDALSITSAENNPALEVNNISFGPALSIFSITIGDRTMALPLEVATFRLNDQIVEIDGLQDQVTLAYYDNAVVTATLIDQNGNPVTGLNALVMSYIGGSQGGYRGIIPANYNPPLGSGYTLQIQALVPGGIDPSGTTTGFWEFPATVVARTQ